MLRAMPGTGLGILRSDQDMSASFGKLPAVVKAKAREKTLLVLAKANSRATVHRPAYLDYVGVKTFDENGEVVGERRFLGLFSSAAYTESLTRIPLLREKATEVLRRIGFDPRSHAGKALMDTLETYPRDELFHTPVDELAPIAEAVMHARERRQLRMFIRRDTYGRYVSVLVYLPRDRYNTTVRERFSAILKDRLGGETPSSSAPGSASPRPPTSTSWSTRRKGEEIAEVDIADLERRLAEASRSWRDDFATAVMNEYGEESGARLARKYVDSFPEAYKEDFLPATASFDLGRLEALLGPTPRASTCRSTRRWTPAAARPGSRCSGSARRCRCRRSCRCCPRWASRSSTSGPTSSRGSDRPTFIYEFGLRYGQTVPATGARAVPGRAARGLGRLQRDRRLQRAGARRRPDLAAGDGAAGVREVHAAGQLAVRARLHRGRAAQQRRHHPAAGAAVRGPVRPGQERPRRPATRRASPRSRRSSAGYPRRSTTWPASTTTASCGPT